MCLWASQQVGPDAFEQACSGGGSDGPFRGSGFGNPFEDLFSGAGGMNDVRIICRIIC